MERFYITDEENNSKFFSICSPVIIDRETNEIVCEDIYETVELLNSLIKETN